MIVGKNALYHAEYPVCSPSKPLPGKDYTQEIEQGVGDTVLFLCCSLASLLCSLIGVMDRGSSSGLVVL